MEFKESCHLYPVLDKISQQVPSAPIAEGVAHTYRLQKIGEIQKEIESERNKRAALSKKYHRAVKVISGVDAILVATTMGLGVAGIGVLSTIIAAPVAIAMEAGALGAGFLSIIGAQLNKKLLTKAEKHEKIKVLADAKLNTISDHISKALRDDMVCDEEYSLILSEIDKFNSMKDEIRSKIKTSLDEDAKQSFIEQGRVEALNSVQTMFGRSRESFRKKLENVSKD